MYQVNQAKIAIAKGGILGVGPGNSTTRDYLPQAYNDFIFAIIIEEYGFVGGAFIVFIYLVFLYRCIRIFKRCPYAFGAFLALGLSFTLAIQAIANMGRKHKTSSNDADRRYERSKGYYEKNVVCTNNHHWAIGRGFCLWA